MVRLLPLLLVTAIALPAPGAAQRAAAPGAATPAIPAPAAAADVVKIDRRVGKLESEMRAVQRKVFPGADPRFFEPEIQPGTVTPPTPAPPPTTTPIADLTARVDALEGSLRGMTGQIEAMEFKLRQLEDGQRRLKGDVEFRLTTLETAAAASGAGATGGAQTPATVTPSADTPPTAVTPATPPPATPAGATPAAAKPATADTAWAQAYPKVTARDWPAVESVMTKFVADWPKSLRIAQAKYWIGRSHAARNQHPQAAQAFLDVYQTAPRAAAAPDALIGLAGALNAMAKTDNACQVLGELETVYGPKLTSTQKADAARQRARAKCAA